MEGVLPDTAGATEHGTLAVGGCETTALADRFGTPLIVVDRATFEGRARAFAGALEPRRVIYAGKSFLCVAICELADQLGLSLDVCTGGELATARAASFPVDRLVFHGNNKSPEEIESARDAGVGTIVVDSFDEIDRLGKAHWSKKVLIRITPGVEAHTHEFVQTGQEDSKFGFGLADGSAREAVARAMELDGADVAGLHAHIGSQIFELGAFDLAARRLAELSAAVREDVGFEVRELNLGGGFGIAHTRDEMTPDPGEAAGRIVEIVGAEFSDRGLAVPDVSLEPGRAIVGSSAVTLYRVGTVKRIPGVRTYVAVDGGMSDNIRPALYGARYEACLANRIGASPGPRVTVAGKHCESGDVLIKDVHLPEDVSPGDLLCVPATGAYTYSMASNYNRQPRPAVVMVHDGDAVEIVRRETLEDMYRLDRHLDGSPAG
ncbi:MAG: diaminopimelate decarboxylase [Actinomycetota bacterium]